MRSHGQVNGRKIQQLAFETDVNFYQALPPAVRFPTVGTITMRVQGACHQQALFDAPKLGGERLAVCFFFSACLFRAACICIDACPTPLLPG